MPYSSQAYDSHGFSGKFHQGIVGETEIGAGNPGSFGHTLSMMPDPMAELKQKCKHKLGNGSSAIGGDIGNDYAAFLCCGYIDYIEARCKNADILERGTCREFCLAKRCLVCQYDLSIADSFDDLFFFGPVVYGDFPKGAKSIPGQIAGV